MTERMKRIVLACFTLVLMTACTKSDGADESKRGYQLPPGETHLTFTFPEVRPSGSFKGRPTRNTALRPPRSPGSRPMR